jgi:hypothetical protein
MTLFEKLKQLQRIAADPGFTENSRRTVLASVPKKALTPRMIFVQVLETAGSLALVGVLIFTIVGGFSGASKYLSPVSFSGIDPTTLHAEADAIDMQIELANLNYLQTTSTAESTVVVTSGTPQAKIALPIPISGIESIPPASLATSSPSTSIDEALQSLTQ